MPRGKLDYLPKRKCDNCGKYYQPSQPLRSGQRGFCTGNCRKEYHKHGGAFVKLKPLMTAAITREVKERVRALNPHDAQAWNDLQLRVAKIEAAFAKMKEACYLY